VLPKEKKRKRADALNPRDAAMLGMLREMPMAVRPAPTARARAVLAFVELLERRAASTSVHSHQRSNILTRARSEGLVLPKEKKPKEKKRKR
jgi:hypothetical protein